MSTTRNRTFLTLAVVAIACFALTTTAQAAIIASQTFESINMEFGSGPIAPLVPPATDLGLEGAGKRYSTAALAADANFLLGGGWDLEVGGSHGSAVAIKTNTLAYSDTTSKSHFFTALDAGLKYTPPTGIGFADSNVILAKFDVVSTAGYTQKVLTFDLATITSGGPNQLYARLFLDGAAGIDILTKVDAATAPTLAGGATYNGSTVTVSIADSVDTVELFLGGRSNGQNNMFVIDNVSITGVPEPATMALLGLGGLGLILGRKRR